MASCSNELSWQLRYGCTIAGSQLFYTLLIPTTLAFCGRAGKDSLAAAALAASVYQVTVENCAYSIRWGLTPLLAQTAAGCRRRRVGIFVQRGLLAALTFSCLGWALILNSGSLLVLLGQDRELAADCENFLLLLMPGCLSVGIFQSLVAYTDTLGFYWPTLVSHVAALGTNVVLHCVLVVQFRAGLHGSALALCASLCVLPCVQFVLIWRCGLHRSTWSGWSVRALSGWGTFYSKVVPCLLAQSTWIVGTEIGNFLAGLMGKSQIGAESVLFQLNVLAFLLPVGLGGALITRVSFHLGSGRPDRAVVAMVASCTIMGSLATLLACAFVLLRHQVPAVFSLDPEAERMFVELVPYLAVFTGLQVAAYPSICALRACHKHHVTLAVNVVGFYVVGLPLGVALAFGADWQLRGLWLGFACASAASFALGYAWIACTNWRAVAAEARARAEMETDTDAGAAAAGAAAPLLPDSRIGDVASFSESITRRPRAGRGRKLCKLCKLLTFLFMMVAASLTIRLLHPAPSAAVQNRTIVHHF